MSSIIETRSFEFSRRIIGLCERLWKGTPAARRVADQLFGSGTSIGANSAEAQAGQTKADFLAKLAISRKESHEVIYWLRLAIASGLVRAEDVAWELDEAHQLRAMITAAIRKGQSSASRGISPAPRTLSPKP